MFSKKKTCRNRATFFKKKIWPIVIESGNTGPNHVVHDAHLTFSSPHSMKAARADERALRARSEARHVVRESTPPFEFQRDPYNVSAFGR